MKKATIRQINYILAATKYDRKPLGYGEISRWSLEKAWSWIANRQKQLRLIELNRKEVKQNGR